MSINFHDFKSVSLSKKYDSRLGLTEINEIYNDNGKKQVFSEIIEGPPNAFDLNERLENDFLSSPFEEIKHTTFFNDYEMVNDKHLKKIKTNKKKTNKRKRKEKAQENKEKYLLFNNHNKYE
jgi:hypothetical protein